MSITRLFTWEVVHGGTTPPPGEAVGPRQRLSWGRTLGLGYAVARLDDGAILRDASNARPGEALHVVLARGTVDTRVEGSRTDGAEEMLG